MAPAKPVDVSAMQVITYIAAGGPGHHDDHERLFRAVAEEIGASLRVVPRFSRITQRHGIWFYSVFDSTTFETIGAMVSATVRSLFGQKTVGLVFRPGDCFIRGSFKASVRRVLFRFVSRLRNVHLLLIIPFPVTPPFSSVATNWIYDPQLWDLPYLGLPDDQNVGPLRAQITALADKRRIVVALGALSPEKGFNFMVDLWLSSAQLRASHLFVAAGWVWNESKEAARRFQEAGGFLIARHIDDAAMFGLYGIADLLWACYAPDRDRSSGIHGRAVQFGVPVLTRKGSFLEAFGESVAFPTLALPFEASDEAISLLLNWNPRRVDRQDTASLVRRMRDHSVSVLADALQVK